MPEKVGFSRVKLVRRADMPPPPVRQAPYVELGLTSPFSFLRGASDAIELVLRALELGMDSIGIADRNTFAGVVRMHSACKEAGLKPLIGCRLDLTDAPSLLAYPVDREGYGRLSRLLSLGKMRAQKGECELSLDDVAAHADGIAFIAWPEEDLDAFGAELPRLRDALTLLRHVAASWLYRGDDAARIERLDRLARAHDCIILATNDVHYHAPDRRPLQDVITCIREKMTIATAGFLLIRMPNDTSNHRKRWRGYSPAGRTRFRQLGIRRCAELQPRRAPIRISKGNGTQRPDTAAASRTFDLGTGGPALARRRPRQAHGSAQARAGADRASSTLRRYFLTVHDIVAFARGLEPRSSARAAARRPTRAVCYCLGITAVDPASSDLLFERFISEKRDEPPDIDVDFEHERREEVIQYIYERYGRDRAGIAATVIHYRPRSAIREVGKVLGLTEDVTARSRRDRLGLDGRRDCRTSTIREAGLDPPTRHPAQALDLAAQLIGFPRHLSQHVGGFVLTARPLDETVPIGNARDGGPHLHRMGQGRHRRARHDEGRCAGARHADLHPQGFDLIETASWLRQLDPRRPPAGGAGGLRHALQGRLASACSRSKAGRR